MDIYIYTFLIKFFILIFIFFQFFKIVYCRKRNKYLFQQYLTKINIICLSRRVLSPHISSGFIQTVQAVAEKR